MTVPPLLESIPMSKVRKKDKKAKQFFIFSSDRKISKGTRAEQTRANKF